MYFFLNACSEIRRISKRDVLPKRSADNITRSFFFDTIAQNFCQTAVFQTFEKL